VELSAGLQVAELGSAADERHRATVTGLIASPCWQFWREHPQAPE